MMNSITYARWVLFFGALLTLFLIGLGALLFSGCDALALKSKQDKCVEDLQIEEAYRTPEQQEALLEEIRRCYQQ